MPHDSQMRINKTKIYKILTDTYYKARKTTIITRGES